MDNKQLLYFLTIVENESLSKASKQLFVAQPYLSQQLKRLESELGTTLIERTTRKFQVTEAGRMLAYRAKQILDLSDATVKELQELNSGLKGTLSIGCLASAIETILIEKIFIFHQKYDNINFEIRQSGTHEILELLKRGIIEIGLIRNPVNLDLFNYISLKNGPMIAVTKRSAHYESQSNKNTLTLAEVARNPLLLHNRFANEIIRTFQQEGLEPRILCRIEDTRSLLLLAEQGMGMAIVPKDWTGLVSDSSFEFYDIDELNMETGISVVWLKNHYLTSVAKHFLNCFGQGIESRDS